MSKPLTDTKVRNLKTEDKRYIECEENSYGHGTLGVRVSPTGRKSWVVIYYFEGRRRMMTLGSYPKMTVSGAHKAHAEAMGRLEKGEDPGLLKVTDNRQLKAAPTVKELAAEYLEKWAKPRKRSWQEDQRILEKDVLPVWGHKKAQNITRRDVLALLDDIMERGAPIAANRTLAVVRKMFNFAVARDILQTSPCVAVAAPARRTAATVCSTSRRSGASSRSCPLLRCSSLVGLPFVFSFSRRNAAVRCSVPSGARSTPTLVGGPFRQRRQRMVWSTASRCLPKRSASSRSPRSSIEARAMCFPHHEATSR